jgi:hypothetical protein
MAVKVTENIEYSQKFAFLLGVNMMPMNSTQYLIKRLLKSYPTKLLKDEFNVNETGDTLINQIVETVNQALILDFVYTNFNLTKQHIYVYDIAVGQMANFNQNTFPITIVKMLENTAVKKRFICTPKVAFSVVVRNPIEELSVDFYQPLLITITRRHLVIQTTILDKSEKSSYFINGREVANVKRDISEQLFIEEVENAIAPIFNPAISDLNAGIKVLWANDSIDPKQAKWKKNASIATESMDLDFTLKVKYPLLYEDIILTPLRKMVMKSLVQENDWPEHFSIDPSKGQLSIAVFPKNLNQITNVIAQIISHN